MTHVTVEVLKSAATVTDTDTITHHPARKAPTVFNPNDIHIILTEAELAAEQADERAARSIVRLVPVSRTNATGLRAVKGPVRR